MVDDRTRFSPGYNWSGFAERVRTGCNITGWHSMNPSAPGRVAERRKKEAASR